MVPTDSAARLSTNTRGLDIVAEVERQRYQLIVGLLRAYNYYRVLLGFTLTHLGIQLAEEVAGK